MLCAHHHPVGPFDIGPIGAFYSFNAVEGFRLRFGGQTNLKFHPKIQLEGYGVYGFGDKRWKYSGGIRYSTLMAVKPHRAPGQCDGTSLRCQSSDMHE